MDERTRVDRAHAALDAASQARERGDVHACLEALGRAWDEAEGTSQDTLKARIAWRRSKAAFDVGEVDVMLDAVTPLLEQGDPFAHHPTGRRALLPISTTWWDTRGYQDPRLPRLWQAWVASYEAEGDPWMAAQGRARLAWHHACAGDQDALDAVIEHVLQQDPRSFGQGPHRHPSAPDTPSSVWWAQLELARTGLWAAVWHGRRDRARDLLDAMEDAAEAAELVRTKDPWFLDPIMRAALAFDLSEPLRSYRQAWLDALSSVDGPRGVFHRALASGVLALHDARPDIAVTALDEAVATAEEARIGVEWTVDAMACLERALIASGHAGRAGVLGTDRRGRAHRAGIHTVEVAG